MWSAPGRVNLIGEHTDYNDGYVLPFALPHRTAVAVAPRTDGALSIATLTGNGELQSAPRLSVDDLAPDTVRGWVAYPAGVAWVLADQGLAHCGADLVIAGEVPSGAGLSSSHALQCAVALALLDVEGIPMDSSGAPSRSELARWVQRSENDFVGAPTGLLDQTASLCCTEDHALFYDVRTGEQEQVPFNAADAGVDILVVDTRAKHSHSESEYGQRRRGCERAAALLGITALRDLSVSDLDEALRKLPDELKPLVRHVVEENARVLQTVEHLRREDIDAIGPLLNASHRSLRDDYRVSCEELDLAVESAVEAGAWGARMTGGGFGGSAIALVRHTDRETVERHVLQRFHARGLPAPRLFTTVPSSGARRDS